MMENITSIFIFHFHFHVKELATVATGCGISLSWSNFVRLAENTVSSENSGEVNKKELPGLQISRNLQDLQ